jgi:glycine reductase
MRMPPDAAALPRVAYLFQVYCTSFPPIPGEPILYGDNLRKLTPTLIHPNEVLDGAILNPYQGMGIETYQIQNNPVILALYAEHGKTLCFCGVILTVSQYTEPERLRSAHMAAHLARHVLGADGVIITRSSSGAPDIDVAQTAGCLDALGVKAVLIMWGGRRGDAEQESNAEDGGAEDEGTVIFNIAGAGSMVSTGSPLKAIALPAVERLIGRPGRLFTGEAFDQAIRRRQLFIAGAVGQLGNSSYRAVRY